MKKAVILLNALPDDALPDELDVLDQACTVEDALDELQYESNRVFMDMNLDGCSNIIRDLAPDVVINLVENAGGRADLIYLAPALLKTIGVPFTGCNTESMFITSNKLLAKKIMKAAGIPTPAWLEPDSLSQINATGKWIVKPLWEDASVGITDENIITGGNDKLLDEFRRKYGDDFFIEEYIPGREFNISMLCDQTGPEVLPPAEMKFIGYPSEKPRIVGYAAKWDEKSFEYENTRRTFEFKDSDGPLLKELSRISQACWSQMGLSGYARIDFRIDKSGHPFVLEINANPCISADSGFYAACEKAGLSFRDAVKRLIDEAIKTQNGYHL